MVLQLPTTETCYFCDLIEHRVDRWNVIAETELTITTLNGRQFETGQCLVLPHRHAPTLLDLTGEESAAVMAAAQKLAETMLRAFDPDGILLYQNNGIGGGQEVPHFHLQVVPRRPGSNWGLGPPHIARLENQKQPTRFDHQRISDEKRGTAELLRRRY